MKNTLLLSFLLLGGILVAQTKTPFYEQLAFDLYKTKILEAHPVPKKITIYENAFGFHPTLFWNTPPSCFPNVTAKRGVKFKEISAYAKKHWENDSDYFELDFSNLNKKQFKIKKKRKGKFPKLFISLPFIEQKKSRRIFVTIYEKYENKEVLYHIEFTKNGDIVDWCRM
ncbi:MAG: hypothetical protein V3U92_12570 [Cellulophaga sp.]